MKSLLIGAALLLAACATNSARTAGAEPAVPSAPTPDLFSTTVLQRANFDLQCNQRVGLVRIGENAIGAIGCGRRATYTCICLWHVWADCTKAACTVDSLAESVPPPPRASQPVDPYSQRAASSSSER
jgi:hypothetical protein